jgi:hypothetical protein
VYDAACLLVARWKQALKLCTVLAQRPPTQAAGQVIQQQHCEQQNRKANTAVYFQDVAQHPANETQDAPSDFDFLTEKIANSRLIVFLKGVEVLASDCALLIVGCVSYIFVMAALFHFYKEAGDFTAFGTIAMPFVLCANYAAWKPWRLAFPLVMTKQEDGSATNALPSRKKKIRAIAQIVILTIAAIFWADAWTACAYGRFRFGVGEWFGALPYSFAKEFSLFKLQAENHDHSQLNHPLCEPYYHFCNTTSDTTKPCCDINKDCMCDQVCGANLGDWACKRSSPTFWEVPHETGYNKTAGCSYRFCSNVSDITTCTIDGSSRGAQTISTAIAASEPSTTTPCHWDHEIAAEQETCDRLPGVFSWRYVFVFSFWCINAGLHRHAFVGRFGLWGCIPIFALGSVYYRWLLSQADFAGVCQKWGCLNGDWLGLKLRGRAERDASEVTADAMYSLYSPSFTLFG